VPVHRVRAWLGLAHQGLDVGLDFGTRSVEAMAWVALTVERSVYLADSLIRTPAGVRFTLANPPLRTGAFAACRIGIDGRPPTSQGVRVRTWGGTTWRPASSLTADAPLHFRPGEPTEFEVDVALPTAGPSLHVRLELECPAIPPLVWFEFTDTPRPGGPAR
jgi:hypothetical protein